MINRNSVIIKSNSFGLILNLDADMPFEDLLLDVGEKFRDSARFFRNSKMALTFRGRSLSHEQEMRLVRTITDNAPLQILCLVDESKEEEDFYRNAVIRSLEKEEREDDDEGQFYRGTLKNGEVLETEKSVIILGDVNPGAQVVSKGNIIVLGCCMGSIYAGASGNEKSFAAALIMKPRQVRIADKIARSAITKKEDTGEYALDPRIVIVEDSHLSMKPLKGSLFARLQNTSEKGQEALPRT